MKRAFLAIALGAIVASTVSAQVMTYSGTAINITFDSTVTGSNIGQYAGNGFDPTPDAGDIDSNSWRVTGITGAVGFGGFNQSSPYNLV